MKMLLYKKLLLMTFGTALVFHFILDIAYILLVDLVNGWVRPSVDEREG